MCDFYHLHAHSTYSALDGYGTPAQIAERLNELKMDAMAITDHGVISGHPEFNGVMLDNDIKPIFGEEFYLVGDRKARGRKKLIPNSSNSEDLYGDSDESNESNESIDNDLGRTKQEAGSDDNTSRSREKRCHITILAKNGVGYQNLLKLSKLSYEEGFYYKPRIDFDAIFRNQKGLYVFSGCVIGFFSQIINKGHDEVAFKWLEICKNNIENFFVEIIPCPSLESSIYSCNKLWTMARELSIPTIITSDSHFPRPSDYDAQDTMLCVAIGKRRDDPNRDLKLPDYHYICDSEEIFARTRSVIASEIASDEEIRDAMAQTVRIKNEAEVELPKSSGPTFSVPFGKTPKQLLLEWIETGKQYRESIGKLPLEGSEESKIYRERESRELAILDYHDFYNYFLIVSDICQWAKENKILCIARGSCGGSLLCWYLGITQVDPIHFDLPVERFIDETRPDAPDIDLDFDSRHRDSVFHYLISKYGEDRCGQIMAFGYYRGRAAIKDVGKVYGVPGNVIDSVCRVVPSVLDSDEGMKSDTVLERIFEMMPEVKEILKKYPVLRLAADIEGQIRQETKHAAGFIIDCNDLSQTIGIKHIPGQLPLVAGDKEYAAKQGLLKIDALSVSTLSVIAEVLESINKDFDWLYSLPLDDKETFESVASGKSTGIFQLQGAACTKLLKRIKPSNITEFYTVSALGRPGPLQSGGAEDYIATKNGDKSMPNYSPKILSIVKDTYGVILFQEQVMYLAQQVGNIPWKDVHKIRKMITSRSGANKVDTYFEAYLDYAVNTLDIPERQVKFIWEQAKKAGNYVFNKAHVVAYGVVGYWTAYLKYHYPAAFTCAACKYQKGDKGRSIRQRLMADFRSIGGDFILLHPNKSGIDFRALDEKTLIGGFINLEGVGPVYAKKLLEGQPYQTWSDFYEKCPKKVREGLMETGVHNNSVNFNAAMRIAPWYIKIDLSTKEKLCSQRLGCVEIGAIPELIDEGSLLSSVKILGKVTSLELIDIRKEAKKYGRDMPKEGNPFWRCVMAVSDETGTLEVSFNAWKWDRVAKEKNPFAGDRGDGIGNGVYIQATISPDGMRFWGEDLIVIEANVSGK